MSMSLDHRSSLRKLPFPACTNEALKRLQNQCLTFAHKQPSPKEIEVVLEVINEFVFNAGSGKSEKRTTPQTILELQMLQVLLDYFKDPDIDPTVLCTVFVFLFMDPSKTEVMAKLVSLAMSIPTESVLKCTGVWMVQQGFTSDRCMELTNVLVEEYILVIPDHVATLKNLAKLCPIFTSNLMTAITDMYTALDNPPPKKILELFVAWMSVTSSIPFTAANKAINASLPPSSTGSQSNSGTYTSLIGMARWNILAPLLEDQSNDSVYARLQLSLLESFIEVQSIRNEYKPDIVAVKKVVSLIQSLEMALKSCENVQPGAKEESLDRLGQFLQAVSFSQCLSGRIAEIITTLKKLPSNRLIQMYVVNLAKV